MKRTSVLLRSSAYYAALVAFAVTSPALRGQSTVPGSLEPVADDDSEVVELSPFTVEATEDQDRYLAKSTLAGTRVRTDLKDVASSISVITSQFLKDTGARNSQDLLVYTTNTEVGGVYGNMFGGLGAVGDPDGNTGLLRPSDNTRVRGLDSADNTRDYFPTDIPWDGYIVDRVDMQRGANSILFGRGSPAGIINSSLNRAQFSNSGEYENRIGSYGSIRHSVDANYTLIDDLLALRFSALHDNQQYRQDPAYNRDRRLYGSVRFDPKLFGEDAHTSITVSYERGEIDANRPRTLPPWDRITPYFMTESPGNSDEYPSPAINQQTWDPYYAWSAGIIGYPSDVLPGEQKNFWVVQYPGPGIQATANPMFIYATPGAVSPAYTQQASPTTYYGLGLSTTDGVTTAYRDASIDGFPYGSNIGIGSFAEYAYNHWRTYGDAVYPAADKGFYRSLSLTDTSIFDFYSQLIDGPNKKEWQHWNAYNVALEQSFLNNRVGIQLVYDHQTYDDGTERGMTDPFISVDIRQNLMVYPWAYESLVVENPYAGSAFVGGVYSGYASYRDRENLRGTVYGELRASDFIDNSKLAKILGNHRFTGLVSYEAYEVIEQNWVGAAVDERWGELIGSGNTDDGSSSSTLAGDRQLDWITYLSGNLSGRSSASGLNLSRITAYQMPTGAYDISYYNSHWAASDVNPTDSWTDPTVIFEDETNVTTQTENPANYAGWTTATFNVLNASAGDRERMIRDSSHVRTTLASQALTWQGYFLDDLLVTTVGYRHDKSKQRSGASSATDRDEGYAIPVPELGALDPVEGVSSDDSVSWGVVLHIPKSLRDKLPGHTDVSFAYSDGRNARAENRYGFSGAKLPNAEGRTQDASIVISTLDDRLQFKITHYETTVTNANLSSVPGETTTLGDNTYYLKNMEAWGTASALLNLAGRENGADGWEWYWNWAMIQGDPDTGAESWNATYWDPNGTEESRARFYAHPETIAQTAAINSWLDQMQPQSWYDAYGFPVDVALAKAGDWVNAIDGWTPYSGVGGVQPGGGGRINGSWPTGLVNTASKGWEFEIGGEPVKGLNLSINASKVFASQTALGDELVSFIEAQHTKYESAAGDLRLWWGGDATLREYYNNNIWSAYQFQLQTNGRMVSEMSPWSVNVVANYTFSHGSLKGANFGLSYRWKDRTVVGYRLNDAQDNLDVDRPIWTDDEQYFDLWAGYQKKVSEKVTWRIQLNVRNVGEKPHLKALNVQPDGSPGAYRIMDGSTWSLTNTVSF